MMGGGDNQFSQQLMSGFGDEDNEDDDGGEQHQFLDGDEGYDQEHLQQQ